MAEQIILLGANHRILMDDAANTWKLQFYDSATATWKDIMGWDTATQKINTATWQKDGLIRLADNHRIIIDSTANTWKLQYYDSVAAAWKDIIGFDTATQKIHTLLNLKDDLQVQLGTDKDFALEYVSAADVMRVRDLINARDLLRLVKNTPIQYESAVDTVTLKDLANAINLLKLTKGIPLQYESIIPAINETARTGLAATAVAVVWTSIDLILPPAEMLRYATAAIEATWVASATDSVTAIELYDVTAAVVKASVSGNTGTNSKSAYVALTAGNVHRVRVNVTTASATAGATTGCTKAVIYLRFSPV
jgi:hypothetical protein